jgi:hypothetical protein
MRELEEEIAAHDFVARASIKEPSAKERARRPGWVSRRRAAARARKAQRRALRRPSRLRRHADGVVTAVVIAAAAAGLAFVFIHSHHTGDQTPVTNGPVPKVSLPPATSITQPFAGSQAAAYADGAGGIVPPTARPVGSYSASSVAAAYATVRKLLIAAYLDPRTLRGGSPDAFARLLVPQQRTQFVRDLNKLGRDSQGSPRSSRSQVISFAPGTTQRVGSVIKVHGTMWAQQATDDGQPVLRIRTSYLFVYPVERPGDPATLIRLVSHNYAMVDFSHWDDPGGALEPWLYVWPGDGTAGDRCDVADGFVHPQFGNGPPETIAPSGLPKNPYSLASPSGHGCQQTTGT